MKNAERFTTAKRVCNLENGSKGGAQCQCDTLVRKSTIKCNFYDRWREQKKITDAAPLPAIQMRIEFSLFPFLEINFS